MLVRSFERLLRSLGHEALGVTNADDALEVLSHERVDVVLCDVCMPDGDGPSVLARMRARGDTTPLVFLTGYTDRADEALVKLGAHAVLGKPIASDDLLRELAVFAPR
jgi:CheY-like chemotaxis protein